MPAALIKPTHKAIKQYYQSLKEYSAQRVTHEGALETAFSRLLADVAKLHHCTLIPKSKLKAGKHTIFPDGTVRETLYDTRVGFWEAKDLGDDLDKEISAKIAKGYPLNNTIFENTNLAVLFQGGQERCRFDLRDKKQLVDLLNEFFAYHEPEIENFHEAVEEFKTRVPELAKGLVAKLDEAHKSNKPFQAAFDSFFALCQQTLNPNISRAAVDEMLVQHLLTERLFRTIFRDSDFIRRNVIAAEIEKVIKALVSLTFSREQFLKSLDRFYRAIEDAAHTMPEFEDKQHFLNTVYERFFQGYSVKVADTHGIVYTPQAIVDFMCASVEEVLKTEFGLTLGSKGVNILDPCTGTGNFIVNLIRRISKRDLPRVYKEQLFANEVMLLPYYIAGLNIERAYFDISSEYAAFDGLCFVDTLDMDEEAHVQDTFVEMTEENTRRVRRQRSTPITVVIGNPPYNMNQQNENDNNKNRKYKVIDRRIRNTYVAESAATLNNKVYDPYAKFFRWATDRLRGAEGIVCFVSNNSFVDQVAFDGMRKHLGNDFSCIYHLHLEGNVQHNPKLSGTAFNVFGIKVGVGITVAIRSEKHGDHRLYFYRVDQNLRRVEKLAWLDQQKSLSHLKWTTLHPDGKNNWLIPENADKFANFIAIGTREAKSAKAQVTGSLFKFFSLGISTNRDDVVYHFDRERLVERAEQFCDNYNAEVDRYKRKKKEQSLDEFLDYSKVKWSSTLKSCVSRGVVAEFDAAKIRHCVYRPFSKSHLYYDHLFIDRPAHFRALFPGDLAETENRAVVLTTLGSEKPFMVLIVRGLVDLHAVGSGAGAQCFPFYIYDEDGSNRRENITDWALEQFRTHYTARRASQRKRDVDAAKSDAKTRRADAAPLAEEEREITKWEIFYYVYGLLHHPGYRAKFADNLKRELPRIPFAPDFWAFADAGKELARLHLDYEKLEPYELKFIETPGVPLSYSVEDKMRLAKDKTTLKVNPSLTLAGIPPEVFEYRLGNRSALDWVIDQYQVSEDKRSGIRSDPNREDDPEYIVRLVGQVVRVSLETVKLVNSLPNEYAG